MSKSISNQEIIEVVLKQKLPFSRRDICDKFNEQIVQIFFMDTLTSRKEVQYSPFYHQVCRVFRQLEKQQKIKFSTYDYYDNKTELYKVMPDATVPTERPSLTEKIRNTALSMHFGWFSIRDVEDKLKDKYKEHRNTNLYTHIWSTLYIMNEEGALRHESRTQSTQSRPNGPHKLRPRVFFHLVEEN